MKELTLPAAAENIEKAVEFVNSQLEAAKDNDTDRRCH